MARRKTSTATPAEELHKMPPDQLAERAAEWDAARDQLKIAGEAAAAAQAAFDALAEDASAEERGAAELQLDAARRAVEAAEATVAVLTAGNHPEQPEGSNDATASAAGDESHAKPSEDNGAIVGAKATDTGVTGDGTRSSRGDGSPAPIFPAAPPDLDAQVEAAIAGAVQSARQLAADGDRTAAIAHLMNERKQALEFVDVAGRIAVRLKAEAEALGRSARCWPLSSIRYAGVQHEPGGPAFMVEPELLAELVAKGVATGTEPSTPTAET